MNKTLSLLGLILVSAIVGVAQTQSLANQKLQAEVEKLRAETAAQKAAIARLSLEEEIRSAEAEKFRAEARKLSSEADFFKAGEYFKWFFGALGLALPLFGAAWQLKKQAQNQIDAQSEQAQVQAQLKAIEIAMGSPTSAGVKNRLVLLKRAIPDLLREVPADLNLKDIGFASYKQRFFKLIELIGQHPDSKLLIIEAYQALLPERDANIDGRLASLAAQYRDAANPGEGQNESR